jgi:hypothetical protein
MSKDRSLIAKGTPRNRELVRVDDPKDTKRYLTYSSKAKAEAGFKVSGFYGEMNLNGYVWGDSLDKHLEAVECEMLIREII